MRGANERGIRPDGFAALYRRAFEAYGASALWSSSPVENPTAEGALAIAHALRVEGDLRARSLAEHIERACRAADYLLHYPA